MNSLEDGAAYGAGGGGVPESNFLNAAANEESVNGANENDTSVNEGSDHDAEDNRGGSRGDSHGKSDVDHSTANDFGDDQMDQPLPLVVAHLAGSLLEEVQ